MTTFICLVPWLVMIALMFWALTHPGERNQEAVECLKTHSNPECQIITHDFVKQRKP